MKAALLLPLIAAQPDALAADAAGGPRCLPAQDGFITMRLRGSIDEELHWTEPALECTGMSRPDGKGFRVRFAGARAGGPLAVVFAAPELAPGASARGVPVNVTLIDGAGEHIYGTQGESRCMFDSVEQRPLSEAALPPRTFSVSARGFCTVPARALDGNGAVLLTRFDFAGRVTFQKEDDRLSEPPPGSP